MNRLGFRNEIRYFQVYTNYTGCMAAPRLGLKTKFGPSMRKLVTQIAVLCDSKSL